MVIIAALWWPGVRLCYFGWITTFGTVPHRHTDFSQLSRVLPPSDSSAPVIYRGLPHQMWDKAALWTHLFITSNRSIGGYRFYTTRALASDTLRARLTAAFQASTLYQPYRGPKLCGGYHPDYCFEWRSSRGTFYALICTGCHEIILIGDGTEVHCDLGDVPGDALERLLDEFNQPNA